MFIPENSVSENDKFNKEYINRNPRNLEQMLLEVKPNGFPIDSPSVIYWNRHVHFFFLSLINVNSLSNSFKNQFKQQYFRLCKLLFSVCKHFLFL